MIDPDLVWNQSQSLIDLDSQKKIDEREREGGDSEVDSHGSWFEEERE